MHRKKLKKLLKVSKSKQIQAPTMKWMAKCNSPSCCSYFLGTFPLKKFKLCFNTMFVHVHFQFPFHGLFFYLDIRKRSHVQLKHAQKLILLEN